VSAAFDPAVVLAEARRLTPPSVADQAASKAPKTRLSVLAIDGFRAGSVWVAFKEILVTQVEAEPATPRAAPAAPHHHHHHHQQHYRHSAISLLGASVLTRLAVVAGVAVVLWVAIVWALA
jgi:hypothetical protein